MKKLLSITYVLLLSVATVHATPTEKHNDVKFGAKLRPHYTGMVFKTETAPAYDIELTLFRPSLCLYGEYAFSDTIGVQLSLEYSWQGWERKKLHDTNEYNTNELFDGSWVTYLQYIMLTAVPRVYMNENRQFCLFIGPWLGWLVTANTQYYLANGEKSGKAQDHLRKDIPKVSQFKRVNAGIMLGIDYEFDNGILLGSENNIGLSRIWKSKDSSVVYTCSTGFTLGYNFAKLL